jgi:hypothetical protein
VHCYRIAQADALKLGHVIWTSYEAFVADPEGERNRLLAFAGLPPCTGLSSAVRNENEKYFALWREMYFGDGDRAIAQVPPEHHRSLLTRLRERIARDRHEKSLPLYRRKENLRQFYDALDASAALESAIGEFGYSFQDLARAPGSLCTDMAWAERRDAAHK